MNGCAKRLHLRLGKHYANLALQRRAGALRFWEFTHDAGLEVPEHVHERAHAFVLLAGSFWEIQRRNVRAVPAGMVLLHPRGTRHRNVIGAHGAHSLAIEFDDDFLARHWPDRLARLGSTTASQAPGVFRSGRMIHEAMHRDVPTAKLENVVESFLTALLREAAAAPNWFTEVKEHVEANTASTLREIGRAVGRHPAHIMREFRRREGVPLGEYQRALRIANACRMLRQSRRSLVEIALACGFADQSHFTRTFKRFVNMTPHAYRKA